MLSTTAMFMLIVFNVHPRSTNVFDILHSVLFRNVGPCAAVRNLVYVVSVRFR